MIVNINSSVVLKIKDLFALIPHYSVPEYEPLLWIKYRKLDTDIAFDDETERSLALTEVANNIAEAIKHKRYKTHAWLVLEDHLILRTSTIKSANVSDGKIRIETTLSYPYNRIIVTPQSPKETLVYIKQISDTLSLWEKEVTKGRS